MMQKSLFVFECRVGRVVSPNVPESMSRRRGLIGKPITSRTTQRETYEKASHKHTHSSTDSEVTFRPFAPTLQHSRQVPTQPRTHTKRISAFVLLISYACDVPTSFYFPLQPNSARRLATVRHNSGLQSHVFRSFTFSCFSIPNLESVKSFCGCE
jgi:hypothetical protein